MGITNFNPKTWVGGFYNSTQYSCYLLRADGNGAMCSGIARALMTGTYDDTDNEDAIAWGYEGDGPLNCASTIIYHTVNGKYDFNTLFVNGAVVGAKYRLTNKQIELVHKFHREVIANLPEKWEMTIDEVKRWIDGGTLPAAVKKELENNQQPKEKNETEPAESVEAEVKT